GRALSRTFDHAAPVVDCDRKIVGKRIGCGEAEIDDTGDAGRVEQYVVAEQVSVNRSTRQLGLRKSRLESDFGGHQRLLLGAQKRPHRPRGLTPPSGAASIGESWAIIGRGQVHLREGSACVGAMRGRWALDGLAVEARRE